MSSTIGDIVRVLRERPLSPRVLADLHCRALRARDNAEVRAIVRAVPVKRAALASTARIDESDICRFLSGRLEMQPARLQRLRDAAAYWQRRSK
jgi:hypothetical protein